MPNTITAPSFTELLATAVAQPGRLHAAYSRFHGYSLGNMLFAWAQCQERGLELGPLATYPAWQALGRQVRKGAKAIWLCQPVTVRRERTDATTGETETVAFTRFTVRPKWFVLSQTDGADYVPPALPTWDAARALAALGVMVVPFAALDGNCQGYAQDRTIAVSPLAALPLKTTVHELAHVVLGHTAEAVMTDTDRTPRDLREIEAEGVALLVLGALQQPGLEYARGYIQTWLGERREIPERSAQRIFKAADAILRAGRPAAVETDALPQAA